MYQTAEPYACTNFYTNVSIIKIPKIQIHKNMHPYTDTDIHATR